MSEQNKISRLPLADEEREAALRFLRRVTGMNGGAQWRSRLRLSILRLRLRREIFRLGHDAASLYLHRRAMAEGLSPPPLTLGAWTSLLRELR